MHPASPTVIAGLHFSGRLMNGAYIGSKNFADIKRLVASQAHAVVVGSVSVQPRQQNSGHGYWHHREKFLSLNSFGMPNGGLPYFEQYLPKMVSLAHAHNKPLIANLIGFSDEEFIRLIAFAQGAGVDMVELNLGCPNVWEAGVQERIMSYHPQLLQNLLRKIAKHRPLIPISIKISPLPPDLLREVCEVTSNSGVIQAVTATNTYPNASLTSGTKIAKDEKLLAGLSGRALKPISLGVVSQLRQLLPASIDIIGCGGISSANDVADYLAAGAKAVQIATALVDEGPAVFDKILFQASQAK
jgi:dihydroorotate dehydrogenase